MINEIFENKIQDTYIKRSEGRSFRAGELLNLYRREVRIA